MVNQLPVGSTYSLQKYLFSAVDVGDASGTLTVPGSGGEAYPMVYPGSIVGVSWRGTGSVGGTLTTGTLTPILMVNGAAITPTPFPSSLAIMPSTRGSTWRQDGQMAGFMLGQDATLGLVYSKAGTIAPTSLVDITAEVWVLHQNVQY
jgi:hypothetical protein